MMGTFFAELIFPRRNTTFPPPAAAPAMANHGGAQMHPSGQLRRYDDSALA